MSRILVTGSTGLLGREVVAWASAAGHEVHGLARSAPEPTDLTDRAAVEAAVRRARPDLVVHAGAWTDVDGCEADPDRAHAVNVTGTEHIVEAADSIGAHVVLISSDYVFAGTGTEPHGEDDRPEPHSVYGRTKLAAEQAVGPNHTTVRTSWLSGRHGRCVVATVLEGAQRGEPMRFVDDQVGHPTLAASLVPVLVELGLCRAPGTFHVTNAGVVSWFDLARAVVRAAGLDPELVSPTSTAELRPPRPAPRPANSVLADRRLHAFGIARPPHFAGPLAELVEQLGP